MNSLECICTRLDYLKGEIETIQEVELKTPFEIQLIEYLWDEIGKAEGIRYELIEADKRLYDEVGADTYQLIKQGR